MNKEKILILGQSGSGKDFLRKELERKGLKYIPKFTTRPPRNGEVDKIDYQFFDNNKFNELLSNNEILYYQKFIINGSDWYYGMTKDDFLESRIIIITPFELQQLPDIYRKDIFVVFIDIDEDTRRKRILERYDSNDSVDRRILADKSDFNMNIDYDLKITDPKFDVDMVYDLMF